MDRLAYRITSFVSRSMTLWHCRKCWHSIQVGPCLCLCLIIIMTIFGRNYSEALVLIDVETFVSSYLNLVIDLFLSSLSFLSLLQVLILSLLKVSGQAANPRPPRRRESSLATVPSCLPLRDSLTPHPSPTSCPLPCNPGTR